MGLTRKSKRNGEEGGGEKERKVRAGVWGCVRVMRWLRKRVRRGLR